MKDQPLISLENIAVGYSRRPVLQGLSASIHAGDAIGLLGANGSGKTTLLKTIAGILNPVRGQVRFASPKPVIGYVPQSDSLDKTFLLSNLEVVQMGLCGRIGPGRLYRRSDGEAALQALDRAGAADLATKRFAEISGGQRQRVLIARALVGKPDLLLLDEPTSGVDPAATAAIAELLRTLNADGITIVMANHDLPVLRTVARTIWRVRHARLDRGLIGEMLRPGELEQLPVE